MLSVAGLIAFFIMIFDSLRQSRAVIRNTFGINRYNTRLNFYFYENTRLIYIQQKNLYLYRFKNNFLVKLNSINYSNYEYLETVLYSYVFIKKIVYFMLNELFFLQLLFYFILFYFSITFDIITL